MACLVVAITVACLQFPPAPAHAQVEVSASVKTLATPTTTAMDAMAQPMGDAPPPVTLPGQILPQYQTEYSRARSLNSREAGETLLILDVPSLSSQLGRPLLLSLKVELNQADLQSVHRKRLDNMVNEQSSVRSSKGTAADIDAAETDAAQVSSDESIDAAPIPENDASDSPQESTGIATEQSTAAYDLTTDPEELARRYATATGQSIEDTEADWLLTHWSKGPTLLLLRPYFQSFRSGERPAFRVLDRNEDGLLSPQEIEEARESLARCDVNRDDVVDVLEIAAAGIRTADEADDRADRQRLLWTLSELQHIPLLEQYASPAIRQFDKDEDGFLDKSECQALASVPRDIAVLVSFNQDSPESSRLTVTQLNAKLPGSLREVDALHGVNFESDTETLNFCAVQSSWSEQVSVGAVSDGYPLLPELDPNDDGRLTLRELREIGQRILAYDRDGDGKVAVGEVHAPIRICFGLGATVHRELALIRSRRAAISTDEPAPPAWFINMDRNGDLDLSRSEFPGTDDQYQSLDSDGDDLISVQEAISFEKADQQ